MDTFEPTKNELHFENSNTPEFKQKIETTGIYVLSIVGGLLSLCCGPLGLILAIIGVVMASNKMKAYKENPKSFIGIENLKTAQVISYVALGLSILLSIYMVYMMATSWETIMESYQMGLEQAGGGSY